MMGVLNIFSLLGLFCLTSAYVPTGYNNGNAQQKFVGSVSGNRFIGSSANSCGNCFCTQEYIPFCGIDEQNREKTYSNRCELDCAQRCNPRLKLKFEGVCAEPYNPSGSSSSSSSNNKPRPSTSGSSTGKGTWGQSGSRYEVTTSRSTGQSTWGQSGSRYEVNTPRPTRVSTGYTVTDYGTTRRPEWDRQRYTTQRPQGGYYQTSRQPSRYPFPQTPQTGQSSQKAQTRYPSERDQQYLRPVSSSQEQRPGSSSQSSDVDWWSP